MKDMVIVSVGKRRRRKGKRKIVKDRRVKGKEMVIVIEIMKFIE